MPFKHQGFKIDVHHHFLPPIYDEALTAAGGDPSGFPTPRWSLDGSLAQMAQLNTSFTILSLTAPGVQIVPLADQPALARAVNESAAALCAQHPSKLGFFAALPSLLTPDAAVAEIRHALDILHADGVTLFTRYGLGNAYLGHAAFAPVWEELNARKAVVFVHPTHGASTELVHPLLPLPLLDYPHETARTAMDMVVSGTKGAYPECKVILSHAGGTLPVLLARAAGGVEAVARGRKAAGRAAEGEVAWTVAEVLRVAGTFYFDLALSTTPNVLDTLLRNFPTDRIVFGTDFPYAPPQVIASFAGALDEYEMDDGLREQLYSQTALKLFPRLKELLKSS